MRVESEGAASVCAELKQVTGYTLLNIKNICSFTEEQFVNLPELYETLHDEGTDGDVVEMQASKSR